MSRKNTNTILSITMILVAYFLATFFKVSANIAIPIYQQQFGISSGFAGFISSAYFITYATMQLFAGPLCRKFGPHKVIFCGFTISAVGTLMFAFAANSFMVLTGRLLMGIGLGPTYVSTLAVITDNFDDRQYAIMAGVALGSGGLGAVVSSAPLKVIISSFGMTATFIGLTILTMAVGLSILLLGRSYHYKALVSSSDAKKDGIFSMMGKGFRTIMKSRPLIFIFAMWFLYTGIQYSYQGLWSDSWYQAAFPGHIGLSGYSSSMVSLGLVAGTLLAEATFHRNCSLTRATNKGEIVLTISAFMMCLCHNLQAMGISANGAAYATLFFDFILGFGIGAANNLHLSYIRATTDSADNATILGVMNAAGSFASMLFQWGAGVSVDIFQPTLGMNAGFSIAFTIFAAAFLVAAAAAIRNRLTAKSN